MINITNLTFAYRKQQCLFSDLNLNFLPGNIYGLLGKNGTGKTTLLKIIIGLLFPDKGSCTVMGVKSEYRTPELLSEIYFIAEEIYTPASTIKKYNALYSHFYPRFDKEALQTYLSEFDLSENDQLTALSYGQKKKFFIAFGLACNSRILIMDEPTNGLDIPGKSQFRKLLISCIDENRIFIISTHQVRDIQQLIDPVVMLDEGQVIFNQYIDQINEKLKVRLHTDEPVPGTYLFCEKVIGGYAVLSEDSAGSTNIDLEILFNAMIKNREKICSLFEKGKNNE